MASYGSKTSLLDHQERPAFPGDASPASQIPRGAQSLGGRAVRDGDSSTQCRAVLEQLLRQTVISRLRQAHQVKTPGGLPLFGASVAAAPVIEHETVEALSRTLCCGTQRHVDDAVDSLVERCGGVEKLMLDVLPRVDAALRRSHDDGRDSTLGQWRLLEMVERLSPRFQSSASVRPHGTRALLTTPESDTHRLRLQLVAEGLIRDGWDVWLEARCTAAERADIVSREWFSLAVIATDVGDIDQTSGLLRDLRTSSCNPDLRVMVLSDRLASRPDRMARLGADAAAPDIRRACVQAHRLRGLIEAAAR